MLFSLNKFLMAVSFALDYVEMDIMGMPSNHGKRTAYITLKMAEEFGLSFKELHDITALAMLHDIGLSESSLLERLNKKEDSIRVLENVKEHCIIGEKSIEKYPFLTNVKGVIKYHHENFDGTGFFNLKGSEIPLMSQIIALADTIEKGFDVQHNDYDMQSKIVEFIKKHENTRFSHEIVEAFCEVARKRVFWIDLKNNFVSAALEKSLPQYNLELSYEEIYNITSVLSRVIDCKSKYTQRHSKDLSDKAAIMADFYKFDKDQKIKLIIAANLHDIGKLAIPNTILDSNNKLTNKEYEIIKEHTYYTRMALECIDGFKDITEWAANHHEKLDGSGYPYGKKAEELDFNSRLMACLDIYEALREERPYRKALSHGEAMEILNRVKDTRTIDEKITKDIDFVFSKL